MTGHFLTQVFNPILPIFGYFNTNNNLILKRTLLIAALAIFSLNVLAQGNIEFIENKGQWDSRVRYKGNVSNGAIFIRPNGFTVVQHNPVDYANMQRALHSQGSDGKLAKTDIKP